MPIMPIKTANHNIDSTMKKGFYEPLEEKANQKWQSYSQYILRDYSAKKKQLSQDFWTDYEQLLAQARRQQQKQVKAVIEATPLAKTTAVATTSEYAYLPWVKLMVPYWDELPLTVSHQAEVNDGKENLLHTALFVLLTILALIVVVAAVIGALVGVILLFTVGIRWQLVVLELVSLLPLVLLYKFISSDSPNTFTPVGYRIFQFQADFLLYEQRTVYPRKNKPHKSLFTKIPYDTIGYIYTEERGVSIHPVSKEKWIDDRNKTCRRLMIDKDLVAYNQISSFMRDVIKTNYSNRANTP